MNRVCWESAELRQGTPEWFAARSGHCTASRFEDVLARIKVGEAASRRNYRLQLVCERLTGIPSDSYHNAAMQWGNDQEEFARIAYEAVTGRLVTLEGFILHESLPWVGCSPDGLVDADGTVEIKSPYSSAVHLETLERSAMPSEHVPQVQGGLWITGRQWCDFISYDPRMPANLQLYVQRIKRDDPYITQLGLEVVRFNDEVETMLQRLLLRAA